MGFDYDVVVVGSGFGGSVSALRLTEKGYPRPPVGASYQRVDPVPPRHPAVPEDAPAALRLLPVVSTEREPVAPVPGQ